MGFRELVRQYQSYDPPSGAFTATRSDRQYAIMLGIQRSVLSRFYAGVITDSHTMMDAFLRTFPHAAEEFGRAMLSEVA